MLYVFGEHPAPEKLDGHTDAMECMAGASNLGERKC